MRLYVRPLDFLFLTLFIGAICLSFVHIHRQPTQRAQLIITAPDAVYTYPLQQDAQYHVPGLLGTSTITVHDGKARFEDSPCPNKTCVQQGDIADNNDWAACLPNGVFLHIENADDTLDTTAF